MVVPSLVCVTKEECQMWSIITQHTLGPYRKGFYILAHLEVLLNSVTVLNGTALTDPTFSLLPLSKKFNTT